MSKILTIVARIEAKKENLALVKSEVLKLIEPTLKEEGCIQYDLHQDNEDPTVFIFFENWVSRELWQVHMDNDHLVAFVKNTEGLLVDLCINEMTQVR